MTITVRYFASVRERVGMDSETLELPEGTDTVAALIDLLIDNHGELWEQELKTGTILVAVNQTMASKASALQKGDEVAFFPPVTGG